MNICRRVDVTVGARIEPHNPRTSRVYKGQTGASETAITLMRSLEFPVRYERLYPSFLHLSELGWHSEQEDRGIEGAGCAMHEIYSNPTYILDPSDFMHNT